MSGSRSPAEPGDLGDEELFARIYPALRRFAGVVRPPGVDPEDLVQEAVARTLATRPMASLDAPVAYLRTAILRVATNKSRSARRRLAQWARIGPPSVGSLDAYPSDLAELLRVGPAARAVLFLTVVERRTYREAAAIVGCSEQAARAQASRALRHLRQELGAELEMTGEEG